jgi:hypothetical protein
MSVDSAGWTEMVIPGGRTVLPDVIIGCNTAMVNASVDLVDVARQGYPALPLFVAFNSFDCTFWCASFNSTDSSNFSCPNNNEVTI